jgi:hypothetical protein
MQTGDCVIASSTATRQSTVTHQGYGLLRYARSVDFAGMQYGNVNNLTGVFEDETS